MIGKGLHGSSEPAAKRRMKVLKWSLEKIPGWVCRGDSGNSAGSEERAKPKANVQKKKGNTKNANANLIVGKGEDGKQPHLHDNAMAEVDERLDKNEERRAAYQALDSLLRGFSCSQTEKKVSASAALDGSEDSDEKQQLSSEKQWLPCQAAYAGSHPSRKVRYGTLSEETMAKIPNEIMQLFDLDSDSQNSTASESTTKPKRQLFLHQAKAIESAMNNIHTVVQTATGSGKSMCFLLPVLAKAMMSIQQGETSNSGEAAILLFPTKALAQDQYSKIKVLLQSLPINAGVIDGDTPHTQRDEIATECQIILTNPDTLHAAILPNWKKKSAYQKLLARITTIVVDEAHVYEGAFGAHVAMVLARLKRVCRVASSPSNTGSDKPAISIAFIACSATMLYPEQSFRQLCPIGEEEKVCVLTSDDDGSPSSAKHFFVWNPPILDVNGKLIKSLMISICKLLFS